MWNIRLQKTAKFEKRLDTSSVITRRGAQNTYSPETACYDQTTVSARNTKPTTKHIVEVEKILRLPVDTLSALIIRRIRTCEAKMVHEYASHHFVDRSVLRGVHFHIIHSRAHGGNGASIITTQHPGLRNENIQEKKKQIHHYTQSQYSIVSQDDLKVTEFSENLLSGEEESVISRLTIMKHTDYICQSILN
jgi:hypothetical protein